MQPLYPADISAAPLTLSPAQRQRLGTLLHALVAMVMSYAAYMLIMRGLLNAPEHPVFSHSMSIQVTTSFLFIGLGYVLERLSGKPEYDFFFKGLAAGCYTAVIGSGVQGMLLAMEISGTALHSSCSSFCCFLPDLLLLMTGYLALANLLLPRTSRLSMIGVQFPGFLLASVALSCLLKLFLPSQDEVPLLTLPTTVAYLLLGTVFILSRMEDSGLCKPFFSRIPQVRYYAVGVMVFWFCAMCLENMQNWIELQMVVNASVLLFLRSMDFHLVIIALLSLPVFFALHLLNMSEAHQLLASSLQASIQHHHLVAAMLSHDLQAPLETEIAAIEMIAGNPMDHPMPENTRRILGAINDNNRFELDMVCNLLHLFRFGLRAERFEPELVNVSELLYSIQSELFPMATRKQQILDVCPAPVSMMVYADRTSIKRVLHNLINNAIKHLGNGHHIRVFARYRKDSLVFSVKDDGPGLATKTREELTALFSDAPMPESLHNRSTGLGFYVARQIVERHGGRIWIEPAEVQPGTHVSFSLPLHDESSKQQEEKWVLSMNRLSVVPVLS